MGLAGAVMCAHLCAYLGVFSYSLDKISEAQRGQRSWLKSHSFQKGLSVQPVGNEVYESLHAGLWEWGGGQNRLGFCLHGAITAWWGGRR